LREGVYNIASGLGIAHCFITATLNDDTAGLGGGGFPGEISVAQTRSGGATGFYVYTYNSNNVLQRLQDHGFTVAIACPS